MADDGYDQSAHFFSGVRRAMARATRGPSAELGPTCCHSFGTIEEGKPEFSAVTLTVMEAPNYTGQ